MAIQATIDRAPADTAALAPRTRRGQEAAAVARLAPGLAVCAAATAVALGIRWVVPAASPLLVAIVLGAVLTNIVPLPASMSAGMGFASRRLLRVGVALLGFQLALGDLVGLGPGVLLAVVAVVALGISGTMIIGRWLGIGWEQRILIACGFSICGAAAVAGVEGSVDADEKDVVTAVTLVALFGTLMIPAIPLLGNMLGLTSDQSGMWAGASIHEVAQVVAAGGAIGGTALTVAVAVKLARVLLLAPVVVAIGAMQRRRAGVAAGSNKAALVPLFVIAFLGCATLRTLDVVPAHVLTGASTVQTALLTAAMFALGTGIKVAVLRRIGGRYVLLAALSTVLVATVALVGVLLAG
ncbi:YeiH family protein [Aldersonia kunmingensis]|uniref:YeiH family protein n=1 Tax=Aldersonia kunmingensis TaxID=408066 RepID=UPI0008373730|nr:putative sulfate exporter family transporter [Aldersonia kunmingensis]